jgi:hypothetical protein
MPRVLSIVDGEDTNDEEVEAEEEVEGGTMMVYMVKVRRCVDGCIW